MEVLDSEEAASSAVVREVDEAALEVQEAAEVGLPEVEEAEGEEHRFYEVDTGLTVTEATDGATKIRKPVQLPCKSEATGKCSKRLNSQDSASFVWKSIPMNLKRWLNTVSSANTTSLTTEFRLDSLCLYKLLTEFTTTLPLPMIQSFRR